MRFACVLLLAVTVPLGAQSQQQHVALGHDTALVRTARSDVLARPVSIQLSDVTLETALRQIARVGGIRLSYSSDIVPVSRRVSVSGSDASIGDVLRAVLRGTEIDYVVTPGGHVVLVRTPGVRHGAPIESRVVPDVVPVAPRPQVMDRVLVMGTPFVGAPERELATAVTVITANQIAQAGAASMEDFFRSGIPGIVAWDLGISGPLAQIGSVRGSSSFVANYLKTYVDGVEIASPYLLFAIDPYSIERIEVIRGPQGSALYGSDAISGVVQIVTRRGSMGGEWKPRGDLLLSGGMQQSRYLDDGRESSMVQRHSAFASIGGGMTSLGMGGTWDHAGGVVPGGQSGFRGMFGGARHVVGSLRLEGSMRYADVRFTSPSNPLIDVNTLSALIRPIPEQQRIENETYGITADYQLGNAWRHSLVLGIDRHAGSIPPQREPATVADALLGATRERVSKSSVRYSTALRLADGPTGSTTLTLGAERSLLARERLGLQYQLLGNNIRGLTSLYNDRVENRGIFGHLKVDVNRSFFLSAGLRGEDNSSFGPAYGTAWSPMLGASLTRDFGDRTVKLRAAYGKGHRPPPSNARRAITTVGYRQLENRLLEPEVQSGYEAGVEIYASDVASLSMTAYTQDADGLVQQVVVGRRPGEPQRAIQYQNVGRIANRGLEVEASLRMNAFRAAVSFASTNSRVRALSATYSGDLRVGDRVPEVPRSSGLASLTWEPFNGRSRLTIGATYIGSWRGYDWLDFYGGEVGAVAQRPTLREYLIDYPSVTRPYVSFTHTLRRSAEWYVRVDNLTNEQRNDRDNLQVTAGRTATFGLRISR